MSALGALRVSSLGAGELFQVFRDGRPRTKAELAALTGLARSTISSRTDALLQTGLIRAAGEAPSSGGRPPVTLAFDARARLVVGCDLGATHGVVALTDLRGRVLSTARAAIDIATGPERVLDWAIRAARSLLADERMTGVPLAGFGVGVPGPVEHDSGRAVKPPIMPGWDGFGITDYIEAAFDALALVDNDVNLLALGERETSLRTVDDLIFVKVSTGIGAGIISGGSLQRGAVGAAGDLGRVLPPAPPGAVRAADDERDLEAIASGPAIARALAARGLAAATSADVVELLLAGDRDAAESVRDAGREIGSALATVVNLLNPSVIVLGGSIARAGEDLIAGVREVVYRRSMPLATRDLQIVQSRGGENAGALGAATMVIQQVLSPAAVDAAAASDASSHAPALASSR
jgi:glucokinase